MSPKNNEGAMVCHNNNKKLSLFFNEQFFKLSSQPRTLELVSYGKFA